MLLVLVTMPMQFLWAAMTPYCLHQPASRCGDHFGHHEHRHDEPQRASASLKPDGGGEVAVADHGDCQACQFGNSLMYANLAAASPDSCQAWPDDLPGAFLSFEPPLPERPDRRALVAA